MNRELIVLTNTQLGFIDFVVAPLTAGKHNQAGLFKLQLI